MRNKRAKYILCFLILGSCLACSRYPKDVLDQDKMASVLYDVQLVQGIYSTQHGKFQTSEQKDLLVESVLLKHGITQAVLDSSLAWYSDHPDMYNTVNDSIASYLATQQKRVTELITKNNERKSLLPHFVYLTNDSPIISFDLDSIKLQELGEDITFSFKALGVISISDVQASLIYTYQDTTIYVNQKVKSNTHYTINKPELKTSLKNLSGFVRILPRVKTQNIMIYDLKLGKADKIVAKESVGFEHSKQ